MSKPLGITNVKEAKDQIKDLKVYGDGDRWVLLSKASSEAQGWMKSTKVMNVPGGCVVQVTTQQRSEGINTTYALAEAVTYVPGVQIRDDETGIRELPYLIALSSIDG